MSNKYHVTKDGQIARCFAIFRKCPLQHFSTVEDAQEYVSELEDNRLKFQDLIDEEILDPNNKLILELKKVKDKKIIDGLYITEDSFMIVDDPKFDKTAFNDKMKYFIENDLMNSKDFARGVAHLKNKKKGYEIGDKFNKRTIISSYEYRTNKSGWKKMFMPEALEAYDELALEKSNNIIELGTAFNYTITDKVLPKGTKVRLFTRQEPIQYDFENIVKI